MILKSRHDSAISFGTTMLVVDAYYNLYFIAKEFNLSFHHFDERKTTIQIGSAGKRKVPNYRFAVDYAVLRDAFTSAKPCACHRLRCLNPDTVHQKRYARDPEVLRLERAGDSVHLTLQVLPERVVLSVPAGLAEFLGEYALADPLPGGIQAGMSLGHQVINNRIPEDLSSREALHLRGLLRA